MSPKLQDHAKQGSHRFPSFMPREELEFLNWSGRFVERLTTYREMFAVKPELLQQLGITHANLLKAYQLILTLTHDLEALVSYKNTLLYSHKQNACPAFRPITNEVPGEGSRNGFVKTLKAEIARIKAHPNYSSVIGFAMEIESHDYPARRKSELHPDFNLEQIGNGVRIHWKKGPAEALRIEADHGEGKFTLLGVATRTKFTDTTPLPAKASIWRYQVCYVKRDKLIGFTSKVKEILVKAR